MLQSKGRQKESSMKNAHQSTVYLPQHAQKGEETNQTWQD